MNKSLHAFAVGADSVAPYRSHGLPTHLLREHPNALVVPMRREWRQGRRFEAGVFSETGAVLPDTEMRTLARFADPTAEARARALDGANHLEGRWLFCGIVSMQFGHVLTRSLGRLWAVDHLPSDVKLLFASMLYKKDEHPVLSGMLAQFGIPNPYEIVQAPTHVEHLFTAPDLFNETQECVASPDYVGWARTACVRDAPKAKGRKLYLTRGALPPQVGRYLNEDVLEKNLEHAGFEIIAPERLSLRDQLKLYAEAETIVASEGSALHLVPFALRSTSKLIVIQRRSDVPILMENQIKTCCDADVHFIDVIDRVFWPQERADNVSLVRLDFERMRHALVNLDVIKNDAEWRTPTEAAEQISLHAGRSATEQFLSDEERLVFLRNLRHARRARNRTRVAS